MKEYEIKEGKKVVSGGICNGCGKYLDKKMLDSEKAELLTIKARLKNRGTVEFELCNGCVESIISAFSFIPEDMTQILSKKRKYFVQTTEKEVRIITTMPTSKKEMRGVGGSYDTYLEAQAEKERILEEDMLFYVVKDGKYKGVHIGLSGLDKIGKTKHKVYRSIEAANDAYRQLKLNSKIKKSKEKRIYVVISGPKIGIYRGVSGQKMVLNEDYEQFVSKKDAEYFFRKSMYSKFFLVKSGVAIGELYNGFDVYDVIGRAKFSIFDDLKSAREAQSKIVKRPMSGICTDGSFTQLEKKGDFRTVMIDSGEEIFHSHEIKGGTSSAMEYLALVHTIKYCEKRKIVGDIYSDCQGVIDWVRMRTHRLKIEATSENKDLIRLISDAHAYIRSLKRLPVIKKWHTNLWGEIPADFGRKKQPKMPNEKFASLCCIDNQS